MFFGFSAVVHEFSIFSFSLVVFHRAEKRSLRSRSQREVWEEGLRAVTGVSFFTIKERSPKDCGSPENPKTLGERPKPVRKLHNLFCLKICFNQIRSSWSLDQSQKLACRRKCHLLTLVKLTGQPKHNCWSKKRSEVSDKLGPSAKSFPIFLIAAVLRFSIVLGNCNRMRKDQVWLKTMFLINFRPPERSTSHRSWPAKGNATFCDWSNSRDDHFLLKNLFFVKKRSCSSRTSVGRSPTVFRFSGLPQSLNVQ